MAIDCPNPDAVLNPESPSHQVAIDCLNPDAGSDIVTVLLLGRNSSMPVLQVGGGGAGGRGGRRRGGGRPRHRDGAAARLQQQQHACAAGNCGERGELIHDTSARLPYTPQTSHQAQFKMFL